MKFRNLYRFVKQHTPNTVYINGFKQGIVLTVADNMYFNNLTYLNDDLYTVIIYNNNRPTGYSYTINRHYKYNKKHIERVRYVNGIKSGKQIKIIDGHVHIKTYIDGIPTGKAYEYYNNVLLYYRCFTGNNDYIIQGLLFNVSAYRYLNESHVYERFNVNGLRHGKTTTIKIPTREVIITNYDNGAQVSRRSYTISPNVVLHQYI